MIGIADPVRADTDLAAGTLRCPGCAGALQPWGHARTRTVRDRGTATVVLRPRRARCPACRATHVLRPAVVSAARGEVAHFGSYPPGDRADHGADHRGGRVRPYGCRPAASSG
jgi:hypothetical protein